MHQAQLADWLWPFSTVSRLEPPLPYQWTTKPGCSVLSRIFMGFLSDKYSPWLLGTISLAATSIATFLIWGLAATNLAGLIAYGVIYGCMAGGWTSTWTGFIRPISGIWFSVNCTTAEWIVDDPTTTTTLFGFLMLSRGLGNILSTPVSTSLTKHVDPNALLAHFKTGFAVDDSKYEDLIIYVGTCFAGSASLALSGWWFRDWVVGETVVKELEVEEWKKERFFESKP